ncbi:hypothetical protein WN51_05405 [Melipona quadrifasciata]|uniref:Uncharacterized protein n=1 Tax=Melipona quadrifasciata TaxID=166423 RepID=A0A0N0U460_9HYME|nr:hypothetical protein WN51_05405 [Melipona quadrifasciata]
MESTSANGSNDDTSVVLLKFPFPESFKCPTCYVAPKFEGDKGRGRYGHHGDLVKHVRLFHPSLTTKWVCGECGVHFDRDTTRNDPENDPVPTRSRPADPVSAATRDRLRTVFARDRECPEWSSRRPDARKKRKVEERRGEPRERPPTPTHPEESCEARRSSGSGRTRTDPGSAEFPADLKEEEKTIKREEIERRKVKYVQVSIHSRVRSSSGDPSATFLASGGAVETREGVTVSLAT